MDATGIKTAVEKAHDAGQSVPGSAAAQQLDLLPDGAQAENHAEKEVPAPRGVGRPPGSVNRSTKEWQQFILSRYTSPLVGLAEIATMPLHDLARKLGVKYPEHMAFDKALDILKMQVSCMNALAPYVHQKMPTAIDAGDGGLIQLVINSGAAKTVHDAPPPAFEIIDIKNESDQGVSDA